MQPVISAQKLTMRFSRCYALAGVDLEIQPGTVFALLGENGAGKTTMIRILTGYQKPSCGSCRVGGIDPTRDPQGVRRQIGYVSDSPALYDWMTVAQIGGFTASFYDPTFLTRFQESVQRYQLPTDRKIKHLSKGQRAKVALSLALAHDPALLIMDEPTSGLDPKVRRSFLESMIDRAATGRTVFLSSHQISEVERVADTIAILHRGQIRIVAPLAELRQSIFEVVIDVQDPFRSLLMLPEPAEVLSENTMARQHQLYIRNLEPAMLETIRDTPGVIDVRHRIATLEEIFVAYTGDEAPSESERPAADSHEDSNGLDSSHQPAGAIT